MCSKAENALFLATEPGLNALDVYQMPIQSWDDLLNACAEIGEGKHPFKTVIIDTIDNAYKFCTEYILKKFKVEHESDLGYGKGYALVNNEFQRVLTKLAFLPYGLFLISHAKEMEVDSRTGKYMRVVPTLPDKARKIVLGMADMVLFCDLEADAGREREPEHAARDPHQAQPVLRGRRPHGPDARDAGPRLRQVQGVPTTRRRWRRRGQSVDHRKAQARKAESLNQESNQ